MSSSFVGKATAPVPATSDAKPEAKASMPTPGKAVAPVPSISDAKPEAKASMPMPGKPGAPEVKAAPSTPYVPKPVKQETTSTDEPKPTKAAALVAEVEASSGTASKGEKESIPKAGTVKTETKASAESTSKSVAAKSSAANSNASAPKATTVASTSAASSKLSAPKATAVAPSSAAAVMEDGKNVISAVERIGVIGSALARGSGAKAEPAQPKSKAKVAAPPTPAKAMGSNTIAKVTTPPVVSKATAPGTQPVASETALKQSPCLVAPASVLSIVSGKPLPALGGENVKAVTSDTLTSSSMRESSELPRESNLGPARAYAAMAAPVIPASTTAAVDGKTLDVPKEGPAAVAVGRALVSERGTTPISILAGKPTTCIDKKYQICFVTSEVAPFSKTGGLGEAMDGLPTALAALGHRVMVIAPRYDQYKDAWETGFSSSVTMGGVQESVRFFHAFKQKVDYVFVDHPSFLERVDGLTGSKLYGPEWGKDFADNQARFAYFCKAALIAIQELPLGGFPYGNDCMVVCNDWHSALVPMFIHAERSASCSRWATTKTAFLCHNAVFQGRFQREEGIANVMGVPEHYIESITFYMPLKVGKYNEKVLCVNTMAAALLYSDRALTVSPSYALECARDPDKGVELEELFAQGKVTGILNGVKEGVTPLSQDFVTKTMMSCGTFSVATAHQAKEELKAVYQTQNSLPAIEGPLLCFIGRLDAQKGYDLLLEALIDVLEDTNIQVVIVGAGRADLVAQTRAVEKKFPGKFFYAGWMGPERYSLLAACDFTLLPSRWEPCGLVQMEAMRVGTCPIVAPTGGLKDTVEDGLNGLWTDSEMTVEAEVDEESVASISRALRRSSKLFIEEPAKIIEMKKAAMAAAAEFTWSNAALQYEAVFEDLGAINVLPACEDATVTLETDRQVC